MKGKYLEIIQLFCEKESCEREFVGKICHQGKYIFSGSTFSLAIIDEKLIGEIDFPVAKNPPNIERLLLDLSRGYHDTPKKICISNLKKIVAEAKKIKEETWREVKNNPCPECDGSGEVEFEYTDSQSITHTIDHECPVCNGIGGEDVFIENSTNKVINNPMVILKIGDTNFKYNYVEKIVQTCEALGLSHILELRNGKIIGAYVYDLGHITVVMMPYLINDELEHENIRIIECEDWYKAN